MFSYYDFITPEAFCILLLVGLLSGMSKVGINGVSMISVPLLAFVFGGKVSTGIMLPILIVADVFGVTYYHRHADWGKLWKLFPPTIAGVFIATYFVNYIDDSVFKIIMSIIIFLSLGIMIWIEKYKHTIPQISNHFWLVMLIGVVAGITTMIGNLAGSTMALYLLVMRMPKNEFIGTAAWFFIVLNIFKLPFHIYSWHTITWENAALGLTTLPMIGLGAFLGVILVKKLSDTSYRKFTIIVTAVSALVLLLKS